MVRVGSVLLQDHTLKRYLDLKMNAYHAYHTAYQQSKISLESCINPFELADALYYHSCAQLRLQLLRKARRRKSDKWCCSTSKSDQPEWFDT